MGWGLGGWGGGGDSREREPHSPRLPLSLRSPLTHSQLCAWTTDSMSSSLTPSPLPLRASALKNIWGDGYTHVPPAAAPAFGMVEGVREVGRGRRWPAQGTWLGSRGICVWVGRAGGGGRLGGAWCVCERGAGAPLTHAPLSSAQARGPPPFFFIALPSSPSPPYVVPGVHRPGLQHLVHLRAPRRQRAGRDLIQAAAVDVVGDRRWGWGHVG